MTSRFDIVPVDGAAEDERVTEDVIGAGQENGDQVLLANIGAFSFNEIGVTAATTGLVHPVFAMIAMVLSVSAILAD